jgi:2-succinyl-6-hydroxy-2,4-cyclohexadiene-1-carboxylate synthase
MPTIQLDNDIFYHVDIHGSGIPLVLLHGFTGSSLNWQPIIPTLAQHFAVIAIDLPGHGQSFIPAAPEECEMYTVAEDLERVLAELNIEKCLLAGYSLGARLALYFAQSYPMLVGGLILESGSPGLADAAERAQRQQADNELADFIERDGIEAFVAHWENLPMWASQQHLPDDTRAWLRQLRLQNHPTGLANILRGMGTGVQPSLWDKLPEIEMPTLLIAGALDTKFVAIAQQMHAALPNAQLKIIPKAGHTVHLEQAALYTTAIQAYGV